MRAFCAIAGWTSPALFVAVAAAVFGGAANAPLLVLAALLAPLLALLQPPDADRRSHPLATVFALAIAGLVLWANLLVLGDLASALGVARWRGLAAAAVLACLTTLGSPRAVHWGAALPFGVVALALPLVLVAGVGDTPPWKAWTQLAGRTALSFSPASGWVTEGRSVARPTTLTFGESHRVTAVAPGVYRVTERDGASVVVRDWRLGVGDALELRPGDQLTLPAGARVRFEAGKRVPGAAVSGVAWAEPPERRAARSTADAVALAVTLAGGALALVPAPARCGRVALMAAPPTVLAFVLIAASWGLYAAWAGVDLGIGTTPLVPLVGAPQRVVGAAWSRGLITVMAVALFALFLATASALRSRLGTLWTARPPEGETRGRRVEREVVWIALVVGAAVLGLWPVDAGRVLATGLGLAASAWAAPRLLAGDDGALAGALIGAATFGALALSAPHLPPWGAILGAYPALVAAPLAAIAAWTTRRARR